MEPKCGYCELLGKKPHCNRCRLFKDGEERSPQQINMSLDELIEAFRNDDTIADQFVTGDYLYIELYTGDKVKIIYVDTHKDKITGSSETAKGTFIIAEIKGRFRKSAINSNKFVDCEIDKQFIPAFMKLLPQNLLDNIKLVDKKVHCGGSSTGEILTVSRKLWLLSEVEFFGACRYSHAGEGEQYHYFTKGNNTRCLGDYLFTRSPYAGNDNFVCIVYDGGSCSYISANGFLGVCLGFCL